tara:strand:+ start:306 stop:671 length:366 start_codon:yes stop_codon:yes gene_type:complete
MNTKNSTKKTANLLYTLLALCKKLRVTDKDIQEAKIGLPLILLLWMPFTFGVWMALYYHIRWDCFGITDGINPYYTSRFESSLESYLWIVGEIGAFGMGLFALLAIGYLWMCRQVCVAIFY